MEGGGCWMVTDRAREYDDESWEEKAFAEDAAGMLGGCVWPPRSYSCSFCRREFRSAQALGGHMNVHRRDRARLKNQISSSKPKDQKGDDPHRCHRSSSNHNHLNTNNHGLSLDRKTTAFTKPQEMINTSESNEHVSSFLFRCENNLSFFCVKHDENILNLPLINNNNQEKPIKDLPTKISKTTYEKASSFICLPNNSTKVEDNKDESNRSKKRKLDTLSSPVKSKLDKKEDDVFEDQAPKVYGPKFEYLDLELRLGNRPKVQ